MNKNLLPIVFVACLLLLVAVVLGMGSGAKLSTADFQQTGSLLDVFKAKKTKLPTQATQGGPPKPGILSMCGNQKCERGEYDFNCCADCGCKGGYLCRNNKCTVDASKITIKEAAAKDIFVGRYLREQLADDEMVIDTENIRGTMVPGGYVVCYDAATTQLKQQGLENTACLSINNDKTSGQFIRTR